ncbi:MAG: hypothetical protein IT289_07660 [Oligoflexia bacterium]|nr:hypothetical protein [Oligoflexia bacterium]
MKYFLGIIFLLTGATAQAVVEVGAGLNSAYSARYIPSINAGFGTKSWIISGSASGTRNAYYFHNTYSLTWFRTWNSGKFIWGDVTSGVGLGGFYIQRSFKDDGQPVANKESDGGGGPAFRVRWFVLDPAYLNIEAILGLREISAHAALNFQNLVSFSVGVEL